jgi:hypothetical protein
MATFNLVRNSRVFFTTNVAAGTGIVAATGFTAANSQELQVLDGFTFSQATNADTVTISEAGLNPTRGQRSFNTSLGNVEFSFSTYIRPYLSTTVKAEEGHLWNALLGNTALGTAAAFTATGITGASTAIDAGGVLTIVGTGMVITGIAVGDVVVIKGVTGVGASQYNTAVKILTATATSITAQYLVKPSAAVVTASWTTAVTFVKTVWNEQAAVAADVVGTPGIPTAYTEATTALSNKNTLLPFGMVMTVDGVTYVIDNCALDQAVVDFGLDGIAMIAWTGKGTALRQLATNATYTAVANPVLGGGLTGTITGKNTTAGFITNKLSTVSLTSNIGGASGTAYTLALTGGSITIANNITYVTPANIGVVNVPVGYYTGTRSVTGSLTAYLRTGTTNTAGLLSTLLSNSTTAAGVEPKFKLQVEIGGSTASTRVEIQADGAMLQIPTIDAQAVMSTTINFTAQGSDAVQTATAGYDIENTNDLEIRYLAA